MDRSPRRSTVFPGFAALADDADEMVGRLARRRRQLGMSQTDVAARMGTSQSAVARLEAGRSDTRLSTLERYATALGTTIRYDVGADETENGAGSTAPRERRRP